MFFLILTDPILVHKGDKVRFRKKVWTGCQALVKLTNSWNEFFVPYKLRNVMTVPFIIWIDVKVISGLHDKAYTTIQLCFLFGMKCDDLRQ